MACEGCDEEKKPKRTKVVKMRRKRVTKFYATYNGRLKTLRITPVIGKVVIGKEYEVPELLALNLQGEKDWRITKKRSYDIMED